MEDKTISKLFSCDLPSNQLKIILWTERKTIFEKMTKIPGLVIPAHEHEIDNTFIESSYASATRFLRKNYSYIF